ncbi:hypothetical protein [Streptomyces sp. YIM 98790]|uniref:hypothetical protein n=1 Tax=Streptomyces sp. YIM 98790 TaxID=2689077 RepID=UPI00140DEBA3|nr:hypothetical protein [Streptomyces sp. YIM 98790]
MNPLEPTGHSGRRDGSPDAFEEPGAGPDGSPGSSATSDASSRPSTAPASPPPAPASPSSSGASGAPAASDPPGLASEEEILRILLHESVRGIEPSDDALERLRSAVPGRRRQRRQLAVVGGVALALFATGTPLALNVAADGTSTPSVEAGHGQEAGTAGAEEGEGEPGTHTSGGLPSGPGASPAPENEDAEPAPEEPTASEDPSPEISETHGVSTPACLAGQLGEIAGTLQEPNDRGHVYGSFRVANVSETACAVTGTDELAVAPTGDAAADGLQVVFRTDGDRATELPLPESWKESLLLLPGEAYEIRFAWVPPPDSARGGCPAQPEPDPDPTASTPPPSTEPGPEASSSPGASSGGTQTQLGRTTEEEQDGTTGSSTAGTGTEAPQEEADGLRLSYVPAAGTETAGTVAVPGACTGTVYRTGLLKVTGTTP